jgi:hypothetical protein
VKLYRKRRWDTTASLGTYNVEQTGYDDGKYLTLWVKGPAGERLAGLYGWTWGGSYYINYYLRKRLG